MLKESDARFLKKRLYFIKLWNRVAMFLLGLIIFLLVSLYAKSRELVDPLYVMEKLKAGNISGEILEIMAVMLPVVVLACMGIVTIVVIMGFAVFFNERRYMEIISGFIACEKEKNHENREKKNSSF
jgi:hypothetical protein